jgi:hypothetical protein
MRRLTDLVSNVMYDREGDELLSKGLYLDMGPWQYHVFRIDEAPVATSQDISATSD